MLIVYLGGTVAALFKLLPLCCFPKTKEITYMNFVTDTVTDIKSTKR